MYCHGLTASKDGKIYEIPCEDSPLNQGLIVMWPYELDLDDDTYSDLIRILHDWAGTNGLNYRIYITSDRFEPATACPQ